MAHGTWHPISPMRSKSLFIIKRLDRGGTCGNDDLNPNPTDIIGSNIDMSGKRYAKLGIST